MTKTQTRLKELELKLDTYPSAHRTDYAISMVDNLDYKVRQLLDSGSYYRKVRYNWAINPKFEGDVEKFSWSVWPTYDDHGEYRGTADSLTGAQADISNLIQELWWKYRLGVDGTLKGSVDL